MLRRLLHLLRAPRRVAQRTSVQAQQIHQLTQRIDALEISLDQASKSDWPGMLMLAERSARQEAELVSRAASSSAIVTSRAHAEEAVAAAIQTAHDNAVELANYAIAQSKTQTEAAVDAARDNVLRASREHAEAASAAARGAAVDQAREHAEALNHQTSKAVAKELAAVRRELRSLGARGTDQAPSLTTSHEDLVPVPHPSSFDDSFYMALEDRFRGDSELVAARQRVYLPLVIDLADAEHPVVDLGCGRGEWLGLLQSAGINAVGVDTNQAFVSESRAAGSNVVHGDLVPWLRAAPDHSAGAITMFQVVEHLPLPILLEVLTQCVRVLRPGGILIAETPNSMNLRVAASTFWLDPTHERPLHPDLLQFLATYVGFERTDGWYLNPLGDQVDELSQDATGEIVRRLANLVDGAGDFTLLAWR